jgi:DNA-directed RNA polymerase specialized sigma24 family protein
MQDENTDEYFIVQYIKGDDLYLKKLVDRYTPILYNFVVRFVCVTDAPDIVQEVFIKVWKNIKKFNILNRTLKPGYLQ